MFAAIGCRERSPAVYRNIHRVEECRRYGIPFEIHLRLSAVVRKRQPSTKGDVVGERCEASRRYRFHSRYDSELAKNFTEQIRFTLRYSVAAVWRFKYIVQIVC